MTGSSSWMPYAPQGVKGFYDEASKQSSLVDVPGDLSAVRIGAFCVMIDTVVHQNNVAIVTCHVEKDWPGICTVK